MELTYTLTQEDYIQFSLFHNKSDDKTRQKTSRIGIWIMAIVLLIMLYVFKAPTQAALLVAAVFMVTWFIMAPAFYKKWIPYDVKRQIKKGRYSPGVGQRNLVLMEDKIVVSGHAQTTEYAYNQINRIRQNEKYLYLYTGNERAVIVPLSAFKNSGDADHFINTIKEKAKK